MLGFLTHISTYSEPLPLQKMATQESLCVNTCVSLYRIYRIPFRVSVYVACVVQAFPINRQQRYAGIPVNCRDGSVNSIYPKIVIFTVYAAVSL